MNDLEIMIDILCRTFYLVEYCDVLSYVYIAFFEETYRS